MGQINLFLLFKNTTLLLKYFTGSGYLIMCTPQLQYDGQ